MSFNVWNNLDEIALYLGLDRMDSETDESFYNRIKKFGRWKYKTDYYTQVHSIPLQTGLETKSIIKIHSATPYQCKVDWEYFTLSNTTENVRVFINNPDATVNKILDAIDATDTLTYSLYNEDDRNTNCRYLIRNSNVKLFLDYVPESRFKLEHSNIIPGTLKSDDEMVFLNEKESLTDLVSPGDFFADYDTGYVCLFYPDFQGAYITYQYYDDAFYIESTEMNLVPVNLLCKYGLTDEISNLLPYIYHQKIWG